MKAGRANQSADKTPQPSYEIGSLSLSTSLSNRAQLPIMDLQASSNKESISRKVGPKDWGHVVRITWMNLGRPAQVRRRMYSNCASSKLRIVDRKSSILTRRFRTTETINGFEPTAVPRRAVPSTAREITGLKISVQESSENDQSSHLGRLMWAAP